MKTIANEFDRFSGVQYSNNTMLIYQLLLYLIYHSRIHSLLVSPRFPIALFLGFQFLVFGGLVTGKYLGFSALNCKNLVDNQDLQLSGDYSILQLSHWLTPGGYTEGLTVFCGARPQLVVPLSIGAPHM